MTSPGWYPDPEQAGQQQFFDGERWTGERRAAAPSDATAPQPQAPLSSYPPGQYQPGYQAQPPPSAQPSQYQSPAQPQPQYQQPQYQPSEYQSPAQPQPQYQPQAGYQPQYQPTGAYPATYGQPTGPNPAGSWEAMPGRRRRRKKVPLVIGLVVVIVAGLLTGGYFLFLKKPAAKYTLNGRAIDQPAAALSSAQASMQTLVKSRHGVTAADSQCYYALPTTPAKGTKKSDVDQSIWCGPVLFVDGNPADEYLPYVLHSADAKGGKVTVTPAATPTSNTPAALPAGFTFSSPDGANPPAGSGGLRVPTPPPAAANALLGATLPAHSVPAAPAGAVIGSIDGGVQLTTLGPITRYGSGDSARSAPSGQRLIAFSVAPGPNADGIETDLSDQVSVHVDGGAGRALPPLDPGDTYVLAVPTGASSANLVLTDGGYTQTLSLLTGKPGTGNITVLARQHRTGTAAKTATTTAQFDPGVMFADGTEGSAETLTVTAGPARLDFELSSTYKNLKPKIPGDALLYIDFKYVEQHGTGSFGFPPGVLTFTPTGGKPVPAVNALNDPDTFHNVFEVPGSMTTGTLTLAGSWVNQFNDSTDTYKTTIATPVSVPVSIPAG